MNASAAYIRAGYKADKGGALAGRMIRKDRIRLAIDAEMADRSKRIHVDQDRVITELARIGFADARKMFETRLAQTAINGVELYLAHRAPGDVRAFEALPAEAQAAWQAAARVVTPPLTGGYFLKSPDAIDDGTAAAIAGIEVVTKGVGDGEVEYVHKIKMIEKTAALNLLGRHLGMWNGSGTPRVPHDAPESGGVSTTPAGGVVIYLPDNGRKAAHDAGGR